MADFVGECNHWLFQLTASGLYSQEVIKSIPHAGAMLRAKRTRSNHGERIVEVGSGPGMLAFELAFQVATRVSSLVLAATIKTADGYY
jgi:ubiquinone/menaquinone biosynthesis C-methylase UbiE